MPQPVAEADLLDGALRHRDAAAPEIPVEVAVTEILLRRVDPNLRTALLARGLIVIDLSPAEMSDLADMRRAAPALPVCGASVFAIASRRRWPPIICGAAMAVIARTLGIATRLPPWG